MIWACSQDSKATTELSMQQQKGMIEVIQSDHDKHQLLNNFSPLTHNTVSEVSRLCTPCKQQNVFIWVISIAKHSIRIHSSLAFLKPRSSECEDNHC